MTERQIDDAKAALDFAEIEYTQYIDEGDFVCFAISAFDLDMRLNVFPKTNDLFVCIVETPDFTSTISYDVDDYQLLGYLVRAAINPLPEAMNDEKQNEFLDRFFTMRKDLDTPEKASKWLEAHVLITTMHPLPYKNMFYNMKQTRNDA